MASEHPPPGAGGNFCALTQSELAEVGTQCRWPQPVVTVCSALALPRAGLTFDQIGGVLARICAAWEAVSGLSVRPTTSAPTANVLAQAGPIDGRNGILGQSYLPCGAIQPTSQLQQLLDDGEGWNVDLLERVWLHELGHALGLDHAPMGSGAVMEPILTSITDPQAWDVAQMVARYGPRGAPAPAPRPPPLPSPVPPPTGDPGEIFGRGVIINVPRAGTYLFKMSITPR